MTHLVFKTENMSCRELLLVWEKSFVKNSELERWLVAESNNKRHLKITLTGIRHSDGMP
jgi:hypothetical protein